MNPFYGRDSFSARGTSPRAKGLGRLVEIRRKMTTSFMIRKLPGRIRARRAGRARSPGGSSVSRRQYPGIGREDEVTGGMGKRGPTPSPGGLMPPRPSHRPERNSQRHGTYSRSLRPEKV